MILFDSLHALVGGLKRTAPVLLLMGTIAVLWRRSARPAG